MGKGDWVRPRRISREQYGENFECIFGTKRLNNEEDADGIQGNTGDGARDQADSGRDSNVLQEPDGPSDPQAAGPVEPPPCGNSRHPLSTAYWTYSGYRGEFNCPHGVGHGRHVHGCDGCCARNDFPLRSRPMELGEPCEHCGNTEYTSKDVYCKVCKRALRGAW